MGLKYVLKQAGLKMGLDPSDADQRGVLLRFANEAASEMYDQADMDGSLWEQLFQVNGDQTISLPMYVGPIRAMREYSTHVPWHPHTMRPRYNQFNWEDRWRSWRLKGISALSSVVQNEALVTLTVKAVENPPVVVSLVGPTQDASNAIDTITMDAVSKTGTQNFIDLISFKKDRINNYDITMLDTDGNTLSLLQNNLLEAKYRIVDVSLYPWSNTAVGPVDHYMEVLYKKTLPWFENDEDEYPAQGYDNIWVNKMLQLWAEEQEKGEVAAGYDAKATRSMTRKIEDQKRGAEEIATLSENFHDCLLPRNRPMGPSRYMGQIYY